MALAKKITEVIQEGIRNKTLKPKEELFFQWKLNDFKYGAKGVEYSGATGTYFTKKSWFQQAHEVKEKIINTGEYALALSALQEELRGKADLNGTIERFVERFILRCFNERKQTSPSEVQDLIRKFVGDLKGEPTIHRAEIQFDGMVLESPKIELPQVGLMLRQSTREDLEKEFPYFMPSPDRVLTRPSAIGELSIQGRNEASLQLQVEKVTVLLRLFKVGSVKHLSYSMHTDSLADLFTGGNLTSGGNLVAMESSYLHKMDEEKLKRFIQCLETLVPPKFYRFGEGEISHLTIAFDRYNDALLRISILEERIANTVMGLEALLLEETQELSYRLGLRIAKIFSLAGDDGKKIREILKDAYKIRSTFAHGRHLTPKERRRYEMKHGELRVFLCAILDYLRKLIILLMVIQKGKDDLIFLVDDALIDKAAEAQLNTKIAAVKDIW